MFVNFFGCKVTPTMLQTFCYRVTIRLQRRGRPSFLPLLLPRIALVTQNTVFVTKNIKKSSSFVWSHGVALLHVTCYMLHVTLRPLPLPSPPPREARTRSCKRIFSDTRRIGRIGRIGRMESHCYMLHVTLRLPPLPSPPPREARTSRVSVKDNKETNQVFR